MYQRRKLWNGSHVEYFDKYIKEHLYEALKEHWMSIIFCPWRYNVHEDFLQ